MYRFRETPSRPVIITLTEEAITKLHPATIPLEERSSLEVT